MKTPLQTRLPIFPAARSPLVVAYGMGVDSTTMLVGYGKLGLRPDLILFADVGAEREGTYAYLPTINSWLRERDWPAVTVVRYQPRKFKHWPPYRSLEENILTNVSLPSMSYGGHSCSAKWKIQAQDDYLDGWALAQEAWAAGFLVQRAVGFEDSKKERKRTERCNTFAVQDMDAERYQPVFPLQEWGWDRGRCIAEIRGACLPVPPKSSCYFCGAMKTHEVAELSREKLMRLVIIEARTVPRHLAYAEGKGWPLGKGVPMTEGLWRKAVKGMRGAVPRPGSMTEFIRQRGLLPNALVDALIAATPTHHFTHKDFARLGIPGWQEWIGRICAEAEARALLTSEPIAIHNAEPMALAA